jgi:hypothetical protein
LCGVILSDNPPSQAGEGLPRSKVGAEAAWVKVAFLLE